jgi:hypothetical protein
MIRLMNLIEIKELERGSVQYNTLDIIKLRYFYTKSCRLHVVMAFLVSCLVCGGGFCSFEKFKDDIY